MSPALEVIEPGAAATVQDMGRPGWLSHGLSRGGAADRLALAEGAALLEQAEDLAALEMAGMGGRFCVVGGPLRIALTGAPMKATADGTPLRWNASHTLTEGAELRIGGATAGVYGYLHLGGGIDTPPMMGARAVHLAAGLGAPLAAGDRLPAGPDPHADRAPRALDVAPRFAGGRLRILPGPQTALFSDADLARFQATSFRRGARGNRMGVRLDYDGARFGPDGLSLLSEVVLPGDIQITGDGSPFVLLPECQTAGGYPRIATLHPDDLPRMVQAPPGATLSFEMIDRDAGRDIAARAEAERRALSRRCTPLTRDPRDIPDLLSYQLISGVTAGADWEDTT